MLEHLAFNLEEVVQLLFLFQVQTAHFLLLALEQPQLRGDHVVEVGHLLALQLLVAVFFDSKLPERFSHCWSHTDHFGQSLEQTVVQFRFVRFADHSV